ncbi:MAG TPA: putative maltokinase, partial [Pseudomonas sp.]|nr:putative maltokinase [Pseudomonas sp.]
LRAGQVLRWADSELHFLPSSALLASEAIDNEETRLISAEQSNSSMVIGERMVLKLLRRIFPGVHPEAEMCGYLTVQGYGNIAPLLGEVRRVDQDGQSHTLMILQGYLNNQGDAWAWTQNTLERAIRDELAGGLSSVENQYNAMAELENFAHVLGRRLGEMHVVLARPSDNADFGYSETSAQDTAEWAQSIAGQLREALAALEGARDALDAPSRGHADWLLERQDSLLALVDRLAQRARGGIRMRVHGDLHLGQVLIVQGDAYLIDFEGEPVRSLEQRRGKSSPLKDVAGMLRSFDYAAAMAMRNAQSADASAEAEQVRQAIVDSYLHQARSAFYDAYRLAAADLPHAWHEREGEGMALALFSMEKAAYEIVYEARYRPGWLDVPLAGLLELSTRLLARPHA